MGDMALDKVVFWAPLEDFMSDVIGSYKVGEVCKIFGNGDTSDGDERNT